MRTSRSTVVAVALLMLGTAACGSSGPAYEPAPTRSVTDARAAVRTIMGALEHHDAATLRSMITPPWQYAETVNGWLDQPPTVLSYRVGADTPGDPALDASPPGSVASRIFRVSYVERTATGRRTTSDLLLMAEGPDGDWLMAQHDPFYRLHDPLRRRPELAPLVREARHGLAQLMGALQSGDDDAAYALMTPGTEPGGSAGPYGRLGGWFDDLPRVTTYQVAAKDVEDPHHNASPEGSTASVRFLVTYLVASGPIPYDARGDWLLMCRTADGTWKLAEEGTDL